LVSKKGKGGGDGLIYRRDNEKTKEKEGMGGISWVGRHFPAQGLTHIKSTKSLMEKAQWIMVFLLGGGRIENVRVKLKESRKMGDISERGVKGGCR